MIISLSLLLLCPVTHQETRTADLDQLLEGVQTIAKPGVPGPIAVFGEKAFVVVTGSSGGTHLPVVAATEMGEGRVVAFGHGGYFDRGSFEVGETRTLLHNALRWTGRSKTPRVAVWRWASLIEELSGAGFSAAQLSNFEPDVLAEVDVVLAEVSAIREADREKLARFLRDGGGLVTAELGWGWQQLNPNLELTVDHPGNNFLRDAGLLWGLGYIDVIDPVGKPRDVQRLESANARRALQALDGISAPGAKLEPARVKHLSGTVLHAIRSLPADDETYLEEVRAVVPEGEGAAQPSAAQPLRIEAALDRLALILRHREANAVGPQHPKAAPSAADFPGAVPDGAPRAAAGSEQARIHLDLSIPGWRSTGLYASPGEPLRVHAPEETFGRGLFVRIGCHSDQLWGKDTWTRHPEICTREPLLDAETEIGNPHGGLLYIEVPRGLSGEATFEIPGAALAPLFVLGETDPAAWKQRLQAPTAPWAELACSRVILTVPTETARTLEDPTELMELWFRVLGHYAELGARPLDVQPQRFVTDRQISAGYMHAGYPIMTHLDAAVRMLDIELLRRARGGEWGVWHELGHNHQHPDWTFGGTGEVTCNLFTLFVIEKLSGIAAAENPTLDGARQQAIAFIEKGAPFEEWQRNPFLALVMYVEIQEAFGWELYSRVFAEYAGLPPGDRPRSDAEKRDQWLVRLSRAAGRDFGPFFERWGVPVSSEARAAVAELEDWLP